MALDTSGVAGDLRVPWNPKLVSMTNFISSRHILSACFHILGTSVRGVMTNVYGRFQLGRKPTYLEEMRSLSAWVGRDHWIIGGNFNLIRSLDEKKGGIRSLSSISASFNEAIEDLHLVDVQTPNGFYTWQNKRSGSKHIASHLDWFLVSELVLIGEGEIGAFVMPTTDSDHWLIFLEWGWLGEFVKRSFRFKKFWLTHPDFQCLIKEWWKGFSGPEGSRMYGLQQNLKFVKECMKKCNKESFGHISMEKCRLEK